jgi:hypothetical protein
MADPTTEYRVDFDPGGKRRVIAFFIRCDSQAA